MVFWHTFKGSKFKFVYMLITLLILANVSIIAAGIVTLRNYPSDQPTLMGAAVFALSSGLFDFSMCVSHLLLAFQRKDVRYE